MEMTSKLHYSDDQVTLYLGDALSVIRELPDGAVDCVVTSPPYYSLRECITAGCKPSGAVLDPFGGAGATGVAALNLGHRYVGIDIKPEYVELARCRLQQRSLECPA